MFRPIQAVILYKDRPDGMFLCAGMVLNGRGCLGENPATRHEFMTGLGSSRRNFSGLALPD
jgi:hypothetical protein